MPKVNVKKDYLLSEKVLFLIYRLYQIIFFASSGINTGYPILTPSLIKKDYDKFLEGIKHSDDQKFVKNRFLILATYVFLSGAIFLPFIDINNKTYYAIGFIMHFTIIFGIATLLVLAYGFYLIYRNNLTGLIINNFALCILIIISLIEVGVKSNKGYFQVGTANHGGIFFIVVGFFLIFFMNMIIFSSGIINIYKPITKTLTPTEIQLKRKSTIFFLHFFGAVMFGFAAIFLWGFYPELNIMGYGYISNYGTIICLIIGLFFFIKAIYLHKNMNKI